MCGSKQVVWQVCKRDYVFASCVPIQCLIWDFLIGHDGASVGEEDACASDTAPGRDHVRSLGQLNAVGGEVWLADIAAAGARLSSEAQY